MMETKCGERTTQSAIFPLYKYSENYGQQTLDESSERQPNLNTEIVKQIADKLGLTFTNEKETTKETFAPIDILDYIYAVLHSPTYREKYKDFLKIDFPRVPYPEDKEKSVAEQQRIVDILDRFDKLCNDISEGLPAEIEARQKQYEYYRDKLLTFKKKEAAENE